MSKINTVIFDLDGTLLDTLEDLKNSVVYIQEKYGYPIHTIDQVRSHVGNGIFNLVALSVPGQYDNPQLESHVEEFKAHYKKHCNDFTKPYPGILSIIRQMKKIGYKMAIVSNKADMAVKALNDIYFSDYIHIAIGENEAAGIKKKPAPDTVIQAMKELGSTAEESIYVGDSEVDILTAQNSGMPCILCEWGFREKDYLMSQGGGYFVADARELPGMISKISHK